MSVRLPLPDDGLSDGVVRLRRWHADDEDWVFETCSSDREISRWTRVPWPYQRQDARGFLVRSATQWDAGTHAQFVATDAADAGPLGSIGLHRIGAEADGDELGDEVGYWLAAAARGRGVATRSVVLLSEWALQVVGRPSLALQVVPGNVRSVAVAERAGFHPVAPAAGGGDRFGTELLNFRLVADQSTRT